MPRPTLFVIVPFLVMPTGGSKSVQRSIHAAQAAGWRVVLCVKSAGGPPPDQPFVEPVETLAIPAFFRFGGVGGMLVPFAERSLAHRIRNTARSGPVVVLVEADRPRRLYLRLQRDVPVVFSVRDNTLTCPSGTRWLPRSQSICTRPCGWSCLAVHASEGCLTGHGPLARLCRISRRRGEARRLLALDHLLANSRYAARAHGHAAAHVLAPAIDPPPPEIGKSTRRSHHLVIAGRLLAIKGVYDALEVCRRLGAPWTLEVIGSGPEEAAVRRAAVATDLAGRVTLVPWLPHAECLQRMAQATALLLPCRWDESFARCGPEAFSVGTPVIAYAVGGIPEWCMPPAGTCVPPGDVAAMVAAAAALSDPKRWTAAHEHAREAWQTFSIDHYQRGLQDLLTSLAGRQSVRTAG